MDPTQPIQAVAEQAPAPGSGGILAAVTGLVAAAVAAMLRGLHIKPGADPGGHGPGKDRELLERIDRTLAAHVAASQERHEAAQEKFAGLERWNLGQDKRIDDLAQRVHAITAVDQDRNRRNGR